MNLPPFPSQDLAKLVLGYLAEEQLMTAYDEFLQASPYLDALRNEYDRIFMTSLKSILAEYRAVKICVETCKPLILRKRLFQCHNLLEVVKFLINHVDVNKLQLLEAGEKASNEKQNNSTKIHICDVCSSLKLTSCMCKSRQTNSSVSQSYEAEVSQNSTETTPLADLPGNYVTTRKKHVKSLEKESTISNSNMSTVQHSDSSTKDSHSSEQSLSQYQSSNSGSNEVTAPSLNSTVKPTELLDSRQKIEEFNDVLKSVVKRNSTISGSEVISDQKVSNANTFKEFASGVTGGDSHSANVPDSSTSETLNVQSYTKDYSDNIKGSSKCQLLLQVSQVNNNIDIKTYRGPPKLPKLLPKSDDQKIKILSDVKVVNQSEKRKDGKKKPTHLKNATSTPLMQMQTIVINGAPAYKNSAMNSHTYTKDEIMAMPTLIVVPPTGSSKNPKSSQIKTVASDSCDIAPNISSPSSILGPLVIDVPRSPQQYPRTSAGNLQDFNNQNPTRTNLVKTVDVFKNASVPKDTGTTTTVTTNTPQGLPPLRKSSSTPRRTSSHVRVLDFTTPRRILHETIHEQGAADTAPSSVEVVLSSSSNLTQTSTTTNAVTTTDTTVINYSSASVQNIECIDINDSIKNVNIVKPKTKRNWDADLRALAVVSDVPVCKPKSEQVPKKPKPDKTSESNKEKKSRKANSPKSKKNKKRRKVIEIDDEPLPDHNNKPTAPVKPTINVISAHSGDKIADVPNKNINENTINKSNEKEDDFTNTPDGERLLLQNVIGAKLNISELLETPYKQALYDIQMETPRFLGPDLPDDPMSDIKIMNIPTPRFLNTPKVVQATPSSYSSRPTDYSSGGSYYKPDEQDFIVISDIVCPVTSSKDTTNDNNDENESVVKKSRPVRQCTKNISYYSSSGAVKTRNVDDNSDATSSCSELIDGNISDLKNEKCHTVKTPRNNNKSRTNILTESNKKRSSIKSRKPVKEKPKTFIKIKPRQTPTKLTPTGKVRRKTSDYSKHTSPNKLARKRTTSKDKDVSIEPLVVCAPTKSRRKSSTPRKLHCTKTFNSGNFRMNSPDNKPETSTNSGKTDKQNSQITSSGMPKSSVPRDTMSSHDSDNEQLALRWSDDGSQDAKAKELQSNVSANESEDISQIKQYIETTTIVNKSLLRKSGDGSLQADLIKRGFDVETAKIIERDLLDTPSQSERPPQLSVEVVETKESPLDKSLETDASCNNELQIVADENEDEDAVDFSVHECNEDTNNYFTYQYDDTKEITPAAYVTLKDNFSMEICIDELTVRLRANQFTTLLDQDPVTVDEVDYNRKEIEMAVNSIYNIERLYTPLKQSVKAQCIEIFDSTLTSIDTPLKPNSPKRRDNDATVTEIVLEEEKSESKDKTDVKKRKRSVPEDPIVDSKKPKHDTQYLLASTNIQNIDIESVLKKLHGP